MKSYLVLDQTKLENHMKQYFAGNCSAFARELNVQVDHLHKVIKSGFGGGGKVVLALWEYCNKNNIDFKNFLKREVIHNVV